MEEQNTFEQFLSDFSATDFSFLFIAKDYSSEALDFLTHSAKTLNYYKREGLLPAREKKSNFSFVELVWIRIVFDLKNLGIKSELIQIIKNILFEPVDSKSVFETFKSKETEIEIENVFKSLPESYIKEIKNQVGLLLEKGTADSKLRMSKLFTCLSYTLQKKNPVEIRFYRNDEISFYFRHDNTELDKKFDKMFPNYNSYISISITDIVSFYIGKVYINPVLKDNLFTKDELLILDIIKKEKPKSITVEFTPENRIDLIKIKNTKMVDISQRLSEIFLNNAYEEVNITTQKGKIVNCTKVKKIKPE